MWMLIVFIQLFICSSVLSAQVPDNFIDDEFQYEVQPPQDIRVQCNSNEILVSVDTVQNVFNGMIYPMGLSKNSSCMAEFDHAYGPVKYRLPLRSCNTLSTQLENGETEYFNTIVVQPHHKLVTNKGRGFHVRCRYQPKTEAISQKLISSDNMNSAESSLLSTKLPLVVMKIYQADTNNVVTAENVKIGDTLNIVISMKDNTYGLYITDCQVQDGLGWNDQKLIDAFGCPLDPEIMGQFKYNDDLSQAEVKFQAHKFPYTTSVYYQCSVHMCIRENDGCTHVPPSCSAGESRRRSRREDGNKGSSDEGIEAMIEVYSGLHVNEATENARTEQQDQISEKALDDPYSICVSQHSFAVAIAIAGIILMLLTVIAMLCILNKRKTPRKDISTTGSSIYSGPYTNTAYSHTS